MAANPKHGYSLLTFCVFMLWLIVLLISERGLLVGVCGGGGGGHVGVVCGCVGGGGGG